MTLVKAIPVQSVARQVCEHDTRIWLVMCHDVSEARAKVDMGKVRVVEVDETSHRRDHDYMTLFVDLEDKHLLFATPGKDASTVDSFAKDLAVHGGNAQKIEEISMDLSLAFQKGARASLPKAHVTFDCSTRPSIMCVVLKCICTPNSSTPAGFG